jgi:threonyl-tRNA synthetase
MERFVAYLTEVYKGAFPTWLSPVQATIIPVSVDAHSDYCHEVKERLQAEGIRVEVDDRNEKMGYKIRASQTQKVPYQLVVGDQEMKDATVNVRHYGSKETTVEDLSVFVDAIAAEVKNFSR